MFLAFLSIGLFAILAENYDLDMPMADLLVGKTYDSLLTNVEQGSYVGLHLVDDTKCHHLLFRQENLDWQIWIAQGEAPYPCRFVVTSTKIDAHPPERRRVQGRFDVGTEHVELAP